MWKFMGDHDAKASILVISLASMLFACGKGKGHWVKPGITQDQAIRDEYECTKEASYPATIGVPSQGGTLMVTQLKVSPELYGLCMQSRGYSQD